jgi:hypothetical protein
MKTRYIQIATFFLLAFLQIPPVHAQRSSGSRGVNWANLPMGYNIMWDFEDGVLRIWSVEDFKNPFGTTHVSWKDCILPYKAYMDDPLYPANDDWKFYTEGDDHWKGLEDISPAYPPFTETPWYPIRELVRQIQIDGSIYYIGSFSLLYFPNCRSVILHDGVEDIEIGNFSHMSNIRHLYFPSSLDYIGPLTFIKSARGKLELVCNIPKPIKLIRAYHFSSSLAYMCSRAFSWVQGDASFLHVVSEEAVGLYKEWWEHSNGFPTPIIHPWVDAFKNMLHRTQPVVEGVDISGGNIVLAPTLNPKHQLSATLIPSNAMRSTGRAGETGSGVTWNIGNYQSTDTEDNIAKVTGDGGLLTFKDRGQTRVYVTTNSLGYYTYRNVYARDDEVTGGGIQITVENVYGTKVYGTTPSWKGKPTGMNTDVLEDSISVPYEETVFNFGVHGVNESAHVDPKHATLRHMSTYTTDDQGVLIANTVIDTTFLVTVTAEYGNTFTWRIKLHRENRDPSLKNITVAGHKLIPEYSPNCYYYELPIKSKSADLNVQAVPLIPNTEISGTGTYKCANLGDTVINITSKSEDGKTGNTYSIHVYNPADADLQSLTLGNGELEPQFDPSITEYTVNFPEYSPELTISAKPNSTKATLINPEKFTLETGKTTYKVSAVSYDKTVRKDYTVTVNNPKRNYTDLLEEITVSVPNNTVFIDGEFEISAKCAPTSTLKGTGKFRAGSVAGDTTYIIKVTAEDRTVKEYPVTIHVIYPFGDGWRLSGNTLHIASRDWSKAIPRYDQSPWYPYRNYIKHVSLDNSLRVIPPLMFYGLNQITELRLPTSLKEIGDNAFTGCDNLTKLISESQTPPKVNQCTFLNSKGRHMSDKTTLIVCGNAYSAYTYANYWRNFQHIQTIESNDATLKSLAVRHLILTPAFNKDTFNYSILVPSNCDLSRVIIDAELSDLTAQLSGQGILRPAYFQDTTFTVSVIAVNGVDKKQYKINIRRISSDASLKSIKVNDLQLYPAFHKDTLNYVCVISNQEEISLLPEATSKYTKLNFNPFHKVAPGTTTFNIRSVSEDGTQALLYKVKVVNPYYDYKNEQLPTEITQTKMNTPVIQVYVEDNVLYVHSNESEQITVYSVSGQVLHRYEKPAFYSSCSLTNSLVERVLIVRGSSGWARKISF